MHIILNMIVKNEAHVIKRCLESVSDHVDSYAIADTGSTDGTQDIIREHMAERGIPGVVVDRPWVDFGHNRTEALQLALKQAPSSAYIWIIDADETAEGNPRPLLGDGAVDALQPLCKCAGTPWQFHRTQIIRTSLDWHYKYPVHEVLTCVQDVVPRKTDQLVITGHFDSARNQQSQVQKYLSDAGLLLKYLREHPDDHRATFYLAQSYRDAGQLDEARHWYGVRAKLGGWDEEVWYSLFQIAVLTERLDEHPALAYVAANRARPSRAETKTEFATWLFRNNHWLLGLRWATAATATPQPDDLLFLDPTAYTWRPREIAALCCYYLGRKGEGWTHINEAIHQCSDSEALRRLETTRQWLLSLPATPNSATPDPKDHTD